MNGSDHDGLGDTSNDAFVHRRSRCDAQSMAIQTSFAKEMTRREDCDYGFLSLLGNNGQFDLAFLDVENRVGNVSLREHKLPPPISGYRFSLADLSEKYLGVKRDLTSLPHKDSPLADEGWVNRGNYIGFHVERKRQPAVAGCQVAESLQSFLLRRDCVEIRLLAAAAVTAGEGSPGDPSLLTASATEEFPAFLTVSRPGE
jgi:hypothetical protein